MRYVLTVYGVPVGYVYLAGGRRTCSYLAPYAAYFQTGLAQVAARFADALTRSYGPTARPNPKQRRQLRAAREEQALWQARLGLLDESMRSVPTAVIRVVWFVARRPMVFVNFRDLPASVAAPRHRWIGFMRASTRPAA